MRSVADFVRLGASCKGVIHPFSRRQSHDGSTGRLPHADRKSMNLSLRLAVVGVFLLAVVGCSKAPQTAPAGKSGNVSTQGAQPATSVAEPIPQGFASLPDRGELIAYPRQPVRRDGAYTWHRTNLSEAHALNAIADGNLRLTTPSGETLVVRYDRHIEHASGDWTWVGHLPGQEGEQTILTFGPHAAFGSIAQPGKPPLRLTVRNGVSWLVETDPTKVAGIINAATRPQRPDYRIPPKNGVPDSAALPASARSMASAPVMASATANTATTVDLVLGYTPAFASDNGGQSGAITRLNYLVDVTNISYANSSINARIRLVATVSVSYPDNTSNDATLDQLTGYDSGTNTTTSPNSAFTGLRAAREQYGADLVSMVRSFRDPENGGCGVGWLIGGSQQGISTSDSYYGYSVVSDGTDAGTDGHTYFCLDETLAHELGHNMGAQHDVATAQGTDGVLNAGDYGVYSYSFGFKSGTGGFYTIMAYGNAGQQIYRIFSDPRSTFCGGAACGSSQADNARTLSQTVPTIAAFRATTVPTAGKVRVDVNGDGKSDLLWSQPSASRFAQWLMNGSTIVSSQGFPISSTLKAIGSGDLDGNGHADVVWSDSSGAVYVSLGNGTGYTTKFIYNTGSGWKLVGTDDVNGDGKSDLLWSKPTAGRFVHWIMNGATITSSQLFAISGAFTAIGSGDFDGNGHADIVWRDSSGATYVWLGSGTGYTSQFVYKVAAGWVLLGSGDVNGDGKSDLLWSNPASGQFVHWIMSGAAITSSKAFAISGALRGIGMGDFDGNGHADVVWANSSGDIYVWLGNGTTYTSQFVYRLASSWALVP
jgi:hypothetical protein